MSDEHSFHIDGLDLPGKVRLSGFDVVQRNAKEKLVTVRWDDGPVRMYDPRRLQGATVYHGADRAFAIGHRAQVTAPDRTLIVRMTRRLKIACTELQSTGSSSRYRASIRLRGSAEIPRDGRFQRRLRRPALLVQDVSFMILMLLAIALALAVTIIVLCTGEPGPDEL